MTEIEYRLGNELDLDEVLELYRASTLGERRPIDDRAIFAEMLQHAQLVVTAWDGEQLVGISRTLTDFSYVGYLADLAVRVSHQRLGIGVELIRRTREQMGPRGERFLRDLAQQKLEIDLDDIDPECAALRHVPNRAIEHKVRVAASNSFGFGGSNTCLVLRAA